MGLDTPERNKKPLPERALDIAKDVGGNALEAVSNNRKKIIGGATAAALALGAAEYGQREINTINAGRNHAFAIEELDLPTKIQHLIGTTAYGNRYSEALSKKFPSIAPQLRNATKSGLVHIYRGDAPSLEGARESIAQIRQEAGHPIFVSADIEGGLINHIALTPEDLRKFNIPKEILDERRAEYAFYLKKYKGDTTKVHPVDAYPLPSQEWLGRKYASLRTDGGRQKFQQTMEGYGRTIAKIADYVGINIVFGPNLDIVESIDGDKPDERNDRSFGEDPRIVRDLANAYIRGFKDVPTVLAVPKHFVGNSWAKTDPHTDQTRVDIPAQSGAIFPYRDVINASNAESIKAMRLQAFDTQIAAIEERNREHEERKKTLKPESKEYKAAQRTIAANIKLIEQRRENRNQIEATPASDLPTGGIMTSVISTGLYGQKNVPVAYSNAVRERLKGPKNRGGLGHTGMTVTDDLGMTSSTAYINEQIKTKQTRGLSTEALAVHQALAAGNEIAFIKNIAGRERVISEEVARYIKEKVTLRNKQPDLTDKDVDALLRKVLDLKVQVGLLSKQTINKKEYYVMDPKLYDPKTSDVIWNSLFSNQLPWTSTDQEPASRQPNFVRLMLKAAKNFTLSLWRVNVPTVEERYKEAEENPQKLIVIDKSARHMWIYDAKNRLLEREFDIGIGKGGVGERRFVGDHRTPTGTYQLVQKRDDTWWKANKGAPLPLDYGGVAGGMLVLAGQWHPEIAIHGGDPKKPHLGEVSNGCVRVDNAEIKEMLQQIPIGTMVVVTK